MIAIRSVVYLDYGALIGGGARTAPKFDLRKSRAGSRQSVHGYAASSSYVIPNPNLDAWQNKLRLSAILLLDVVLKNVQPSGDPEDEVVIDVLSKTTEVAHAKRRRAPEAEKERQTRARLEKEAIAAAAKAEKEAARVAEEAAKAVAKARAKEAADAKRAEDRDKELAEAEAKAAAEAKARAAEQAKRENWRRHMREGGGGCKGESRQGGCSQGEGRREGREWRRRKKRR